MYSLATYCPKPPSGSVLHVAICMGRGCWCHSGGGVGAFDLPVQLVVSSALLKFNPGGTHFVTLWV